MNTDTELADFNFQRMSVDTTGVNPEPRLDLKWSEFKQLTWKAGVAHAETGIDVKVERTFSDDFNVAVGFTHCSGFSFREAWSLLVGIAVAGREAKRATEATR